MRAGEIWWSQIGNSIRFLDGIVNALRDARSAILDIRKSIPWREEFYEAVDVRRASHTGHRRLIRREWTAGSNPGRFLLDAICTSEEQANYYPGWSFAQYLSATENISIRDYYVWITAIHNKSDMRKWVDFLTEYGKLTQDAGQRATFILEYDGVPISFGSVESLQYCVQKYDCRIFAMSSAASVENTKYIGYQSELAISLSAEDPQLCWELILRGNELLYDPVGAMEYVVGPNRMDIQTIRSRVWEAGLIHLFPRIEQYRLSFIGKHTQELMAHLPIDNGDGEMITEPEDLEMGNLWFLVNHYHGMCSRSDFQNIKLCRDIRNNLAHNKPVPFDSIEMLHALD